MVVLIKIVYLIMSLSLLVFLHEMGHFIAARWFKIKVDKFYLFFDFLFPLPNVLKFSLFKKQIGDTEWGLGWFPMGGYVQISGMVDESMDKETMAQPEQPWEFRSKPAWQRLIVMIGGVVVNLLLGFVIFSFIMAKWGEVYIPTANLKYGIYADSLGTQMGLKTGDKIVSVDNKTVENFNAIAGEIILNNSSTIQIIRDSQKMEITIPKGMISKLSTSKNQGFIEPRKKFIVTDIAAGSGAAKAGLQPMDKVVGINDSNICFYDQVAPFLKSHKAQTIHINVDRKGEIIKKDVAVSESGTLGVVLGDTSDLKYNMKKYSVVAAVPAGINRSFEILGNYIKGLNQIFKSFFGKSEVKASENVGGFISMGKMMPAEWGDWYGFWTLTGILSLVLAFMNMLPIPALDGGHVVFCLYEMIFRRKPSVKVLEYAQYVGMALLLALMVYANGNDIYRHFFK